MAYKKEYKPALRKHITVLCLYILLTGILLRPLPFHLATGLLHAEEGDPLMQIWVIQWNIHKLTTSTAHYFDANIFYPYPNTFAYHDHLFGLGLLGLPIYLLSHNPILTYNLLLCLSFVLSAYGMCLFCRHITGNWYAAFLAGLMFGFLPYRFAHLDHLNLLSIQWLPFCLLFLTRYLLRLPERSSERSVRRNMLLVALFWGFFLLQVLTTFNYLFVLTLTVVIVAGVQTLVCGKLKFALQSKLKFALRDMALLMSGGVLAGLLLLPFLWPYLQANRDMGFQRTLAEAQALSARLQDYLVAPEENLLYGRLTRTLQSPASPFPREQMLFPGILSILLGVIGIWRPARGQRLLRTTYLVLLVVAVVLSLGPSMTLFGKTMPLPYALLYHYLPGFKAMRVPARFGLLASFALCVLAALGVAQIYRWFSRLSQSSLRQVLITGVLAGVLALEYYSPPKPLNVYPGTRDTIPAVYQWLAQQPGNRPIIELPVRSAKDNFEYAYYSTFHWKPMVNGRSAFIPNGITQVFGAMRDFPAPQTIELLQSLGIRSVILHTDNLPQPLPTDLPENLSLQHSFGNTIVLDVALQKGISTKGCPLSFNVRYHLPSSLSAHTQYTMGVALISHFDHAVALLPHENVTFKIAWKRYGDVIETETRTLSLPIGLGGKEQFILSVPIMTPVEIGDYRIEVKNSYGGEFSKPITILPEVVDSRKPSKLQVEFVQADIPEVWESGKLLPIRVRVKNTGDTLWKARVADRTHPVGEVHLGVADWQDLGSGISLRERQPQLFLARGFLPYDLPPGEDVLISAEIRTPDLPGEYILALDMVSELIQWFARQDSPPFKKKIIVTTHSS